jgi:hypothetical protein
MLTCTLTFRTWLRAACLTLLLAPALHAQTNVRAWHTAGQTWVVWNTATPIPPAYSIYRAPTPFSSTAQATLCGQSIEPEWSGWRLKLADSAATWRVPKPDRSTYQLAADEGVFVYTPHAASTEYFAVVGWGATLVTPANITAGPVPQGYDPLNDPVTCHVQIQSSYPVAGRGSFPYTVYAMWVDGRDDLTDARPDFPVLANAAKSGAPHMFAIYEPINGILPAQPFPATLCLHGGGPNGTYWNWRPWYDQYDNIGVEPSNGITIAHDDRCYKVAQGMPPGDDCPSYWLGWYMKMEGVNPRPARNNDVVAAYTTRRLMWIQDWIETWSPYAGRVDPKRVSVMGTSMGGFGTQMLARFRPERISSACAFVTPIYHPDNPNSNNWLGTPEQNLQTVELGLDGHPLRINQFFDPTCMLSPALRDRAFTRIYRGRNETDLPPTFYSWEEQHVVAAFRALDDARTGVHLYWDNRDHTPDWWDTDNPNVPEVDIGEWVFPVRTDRGTVDCQSRYRADQSYPGFYNDDQDPAAAGRQPDPGNGSHTDGTPWGTWGGYFDWDTTTITDTPGAWGCTVFLVGQSAVSVDNFPGASATTDVTVRKPQAFRPAPGQSIAWRLRRLADGAILQEGAVQPDADGVVAIQGLTIRKDPDRSRIELAVQTAAPLTLRNGYNLIALPIQPWGTPFTAESLAQHIAANSAPPVTCTSVIRYVSSSGQFETHPVGTAVSNFEIAVGIGYFIRCQVAGSSATWTLTGRPLSDPSAQLALAGGYNLIGLPRQPATPYTAEDAGIEINGQGGSVTQVIRYDAETGQFVTHPIGTAVSNFTLQPGEGYFIRCGGPSTWSLNRP